MREEDSVAGENEGDALGDPPLHNPTTGKFAKGHAPSGQGLREEFADLEGVNRATIKDEFVSGVVAAWRDKGPAGVRQAYKDKPQEFLAFLGRIVNANESDVVVQRLVVMGYPVMPPVDWVPELIPMSDNGNAT